MTVEEMRKEIRARLDRFRPRYDPTNPQQKLAMTVIHGYVQMAAHRSSVAGGFLEAARRELDALEKLSPG